MDANLRDEDARHTALRQLSDGWTEEHGRLVRLRARVLAYCALALGLGTAIGWWL
jgi:hypothetical protein